MRTVSVIFILLAISAFPAASAENNTTPTVITVDSTNLRFSPSSVTINETESVRFFWDGQLLPHNAVEENGVFDSGDTENNEDYQFVFIKGINGTFSYYCEPHRILGMVGTITVNPITVVNETNETTVEPTPMEEDEESFIPFLQLPIVMTCILLAAIRTRVKED